jgi:hypothetical protein
MLRLGRPTPTLAKPVVLRACVRDCAGREELLTQEQWSAASMRLGRPGRRDDRAHPSACCRGSKRCSASPKRRYANQVRVATPGPGRPRVRPNSITGDRAYSSRANRQALRDKHITTTIPQPKDQIANRLRKGRNAGRPPALDPTADKPAQPGRTWLQPAQALAWIGDPLRLCAHFQATLDLVEMLGWLRAVPESFAARCMTMRPGNVPAARAGRIQSAGGRRGGLIHGCPSGIS